MTPSPRAHWPFSRQAPRRIVLKAGSNVLSSRLGTLDLALVNRLALEIASAIQQNIEVIYVSSGAVACGIGIMGRPEKPRSIPEKQALAAIGQCRLRGPPGAALCIDNPVYSRGFERVPLRSSQWRIPHR